MAEVPLTKLAVVVSTHCIDQMKIGIALILPDDDGVIIRTWDAEDPDVVFYVVQYHLGITHVVLSSVPELPIIIIAACI